MIDPDPLYERFKDFLRAELETAERSHAAEVKRLDAVHAGEIERWKANNAIALAQMQVGIASLNATIGFATAGLRGLFLLNGGGAIGLLTFAGNVLTKSPQAALLAAGLSGTMDWFVCGLVASIAANFFAYLTQDLLSNLMASGAEKSSLAATRLKLTTVVMGAISLGCFLAGALIGASALGTVP